MELKAGQRVRQRIAPSETKDGVSIPRDGEVVRTLGHGLMVFVRWAVGSSWEDVESLEIRPDAAGAYLPRTGTT